jgi:hypothetical protein
VAFAIMAFFALSSLAVGAMARDAEAEDRRTDLPLTMVLTWVVLYVLDTGLAVVILMALSWPAFMVFAALVLMRGHSWKWIGLGLVALVFFNLVVFFAYWRG